MLSIEFLLLYLALGGFVGFMAGLLGVGGGGILVPLLALLFGYQGMASGQVIHLALGTALTCMIVSSAASIRAHASRGAVQWHIVASMAAGILVGAFMTARWSSHINPAYIALFFSLFMAIIALQMFMNWKPRPSQSPVSLPGLLLAGLGIGAVSALAAVGGGFLTLVYLGYKNVELRKTIGTSAAIGFPIAIAGSLGYLVSGWSHTSEIPYTLGYIYLPAFVTIALASMAAAPLGARCSHNLPEVQLKRIFGLVSLALSIKMLAVFV
ncbi:sulfite exporter TauE/SafE family protein [Shewanella sp. AS16]|uniref:sulfite exporter TauE/SafE family protein n=1 Tax=Shewanella sp. AS16 TaxID=2907625 RepID=UPI001F384C58|nr:sulfite exporter TauE/SafE family protein [Shewanella sp. AS16]MCE9686429.1 sulfite exporter TauE/SafE family protein [Shewanella sp. AS16]